MYLANVKSAIWTHCPALTFGFVIAVAAAPDATMFTLSGNLVFVFLLALV